MNLVGRSQVHWPRMFLSYRPALALALALTVVGAALGACGSEDDATTSSSSATGGSPATGGAASSGGAGSSAGGGGQAPNMCSDTVLDCDPAVADCETDITSDPAHCGGCDMACTNIASATATCVDQTCGFACLTGRTDCNNDVGDGCETDSDSSNMHCGGCDSPCAPVDHATAECLAGMCEQTCDLGWDNCNNDLGDGCEQSLGEISHCSACNVVCPAESGTAVCSRGLCSILLGQAPSAVVDLDAAGGFVYFTAPATGLFRIPTSGGAVETLVLGSSEVGKYLGVVGGNVYYPVVVGASVVVRSVPIAGGTPVDLSTITATPQVGGFAVGTSEAFVTVDDELWRVPLAGGTAVSVANTESTPAFANGSVYYIDDASHNLRSTPEGGGTETIVSAQNFGMLNFDIFLAVQSDYAFVAHSSLQRVTLAGGAKQFHGGFFFYGSDVAADAQHVYSFSTYNVGSKLFQTLDRRPVSVSTSEFLALDRESFTATLALDATHVYFATGTVIEKMPK
jgi:hypothetical protein